MKDVSNTKIVHNPIATVIKDGVTYKLHELLMFSQHDDSCVVQRSNVLHTLRNVLKLHNGEIAYDCGIDAIYNLCAVSNAVNTYDDWLETCNQTIHEVRPKIKQKGLTYLPKVIKTNMTEISAFWIRGDVFDALNLESRLAYYPVLSDDAFNEVEAIIQDYSWSEYIYEDLKIGLEKVSVLQQLAINIKNQTIENPTTFTEAQVKAAFWEHLKLRGDHGHIINNKWKGFPSQDTEFALEVAKILWGITKPRTTN